LFTIAENEFGDVVLEIMTSGRPVRGRGGGWSGGGQMPKKGGLMIGWGRYQGDSETTQKEKRLGGAEKKKGKGRGGLGGPKGKDRRVAFMMPQSIGIIKKTEGKKGGS